ncbi:PTS transporter subunit EIIC [Clostridium sp. C2-6-12]|uniref:PTS sugar transporter subunit IIC n=1 Tax=Clostridium sp. C2-6-12 TaxID=2698832 RepID=UPI00136EBF5B|nr:PTS transporter subunit EIIC [Clostridium sp. C2-6-12]
MSNFSQVVEQKITPFVGKISSNKGITAITRGMMSIMPLTLGTCLIAIVGNLPIPAWTNWLASVGITPHLSAVIGGTTELYAIFIAFSVAYQYAKLEKADEITVGILSLASFFILMPQKIKVADDKFLDALTKNYLGSNGIFVAMIVAISVSLLYCYLNKKGIIIKLPDSIPEMVTKSLEPTFIAMIIFGIVFLVRVGFGSTSFGNIFEFITNVIGKPIMYFGATPFASIAVYVIFNLFWCFGIHPNTLGSVYMPVVMTAVMANIGAYQAGQPLPYLAFGVLAQYLMLGGTGCTLGLAIDMLLFSKSERFKSLGKLAIIPSIFNINEPLIFGAPIIFNPIFIPPMMLSVVVSGSIGVLFVKLGAYNSFNPVAQFPFTMPHPIGALLTSGIMALVGVCCAIIATAVVFYPFFKYADNQALKEEAQNN